MWSCQWLSNMWMSSWMEELPWKWEKELCKPPWLLAESKQDLSPPAKLHTSHYQTTPEASEFLNDLLRVANLLPSRGSIISVSLWWTAHGSYNNQDLGFWLHSPAVSMKRQNTLESKEGCRDPNVLYLIWGSGHMSESICKTFFEFCTYDMWTMICAIHMSLTSTENFKEK